MIAPNFRANSLVGKSVIDSPITKVSYSSYLGTLGDVNKHGLFMIVNVVHEKAMRLFFLPCVFVAKGLYCQIFYYDIVGWFS